MDPTDPVVRLNVNVPLTLRRQLAEAAAANGISLSDLVRLLLRRFLRQHLLDRGVPS